MSYIFVSQHFHDLINFTQKKYFYKIVNRNKDYFQINLWRIQEYIDKVDSLLHLNLKHIN